MGFCFAPGKYKDFRLICLFQQVDPAGPDFGGPHCCFYRNYLAPTTGREFLTGPSVSIDLPPASLFSMQLIGERVNRVFASQPVHADANNRVWSWRIQLVQWRRQSTGNRKLFVKTSIFSLVKKYQTRNPTRNHELKDNSKDVSRMLRIVKAFFMQKKV